MKRFSGLFVLLLLVILSGCSHRVEDTVKVMTLNVRYDNPQDSVNSWPNRASIVTDLIKNEKPDLLGMQEILYHQYEYLDSVLIDYISAGVGRADGAKEGEMNPVFFRKDRFDMTRTKTFWLSETPEIAGSLSWGSSLPRIVTWVELVDKNSHQHLFYFNTHFAHDSDSARIMSSKLLLRKVDSIASGYSFFITGDFNMLPSSKGYGILTGPAESIPLLEDTYLRSVKRPEGPGFTFNGFSDKPGYGRIDFIFAKDGLKVLIHKTIIKKEHGIFISDHWPVLSIISLNADE
jgi:endonuclease/exonuclease/phosphatase family metal-dependent hydrolase